MLQFLERGRDFSVLGLGLRRRFKTMSARLQRHLLYPPLLQEWAAYSLAERSRIITEVWGEAVSESQLHRFYCHNKVRFLTAKLRYRYAQLNRPRLDARRRQFALTLGNLIAAKAPICYVDETTFNVQTAKRKSWALSGEPNHHSIESLRQSTTVYCAVGACLTKPVFMQGRSTCTDEYIRFVELLATHVKRGVRKPWLVFDGATAHRSLRSLAAVEMHFKPLCMAPYSSPFNPVETVWSLARRLFQKHQLVHRGYISEANFLSMVDAACHGISGQAHQGVLRAHHGHIRDHLELAVGNSHSD